MGRGFDPRRAQFLLKPFQLMIYAILVQIEIRTAFLLGATPVLPPKASRQSQCNASLHP